MNRQNGQKYRLSQENKTMKNLQSKNNVHKISLFATALTLSLTIQLVAQSIYPTFEESANQSNIQALAESPEID